MKKNVFAMAIAACMAASLAACGGAGTAETTGAQTTASFLFCIRTQFSMKY